MGTAQKALGFVRHAPVQGEHPLHAYFRTAPDNDGHIDYPTWLPTGDIHIRMNALTERFHKVDARNDGAVARLLLHEATHKWANTLDICYKWDTVAQQNKHHEWEKAKMTSSRAWRLGDAISTGAQPSVALPGRKKPVLSMAKVGVAVGEWVYNADSYACAASRLWKEETKVCTQAYGNWED